MQATETNKPKLSARNLRKSYKKREVVRDVSLEMSCGQIVGLLGPNGAGKTTTFYMITGLVVPDAGSVFLGDKDITTWPMHERARAGIAYLPQEPSVFRKLTVEENILATLETRPMSEGERTKLLRALLDDFSLNHVSQQLAYTLSGGERRRVEVARALALEPQYILLDEPFAGVDPLAVTDIQKMIQKLKERGIGVLITDHNVRETLSICDWAYILTDGVLFESGTPEQIANSPRAREKYLGEQFKF